MNDVGRDSRGYAGDRGLTLAIVFLSLKLQIAQQPLEALLVCVVVLPASEVADVAAALDVRRPAGCAVHDGIVQADWEEHRFLALPLLLEGGLDLLLYPVAREGSSESLTSRGFQIGERTCSFDAISAITYRQ